MEKKWYIAYTKSHCEKKVAALLTRKKIHNYCPLNRMVNYQGQKKRIAFEPLFPSFVFVYISEAEMNKIKKIGSVLSFAYWLAKPAIINDAEIMNVQHFVNQHSNIKLEKAGVDVNGTVRIVSEPQIDIIGNTNVVSIKNSNIKMLLPSLGFLMTAEMEKSTIDVFNYGFERSKMVS